MSTSKPTSAAIASDLDLLRSLPPTSLEALRKLVSPSSAPTRTDHAPPRGDAARAVDLIDTFRPRGATTGNAGDAAHHQFEAAQELSRAYIRDMQEVRARNDGSLEKLGERIDELRGRASKVGEALGEVKV